MTQKRRPVLFLSIFLISCYSAGVNNLTTLPDCQQATKDGRVTSIKANFTPPAPTSSSTVPPAAITWDANIYYANFNATQEEKVQRAVELMKKVIASEKFKEKVINHRYNGKKTYFDNGGLSNARIYQKILEGAEEIGVTSKNNALDVELELYYSLTTTIGYTYPNVTRIWMNTKYFNKYTAVQVAGNLMHEWMHKLGFVHATTWSTSRDYSVPYAIGYLMEELSRQYL